MIGEYLFNDSLLSMSHLLTGVILWLLASVAVMTPFRCYADDAVIIAVNEDILPDYLHFLNQRDPLAVHEYKGEGARRDVIELVLLMQAVRLGGYRHPITLQAEQSYLRTLRDIGEGHFITSAGLVWQSDIAMMTNAYFTSRPLIKEGEFVVGFYTTLKNQKALQANSLSKLAELDVVTSSQWKNDVRALKELGLTHITYSPNWINMARMIEAGRADITLAPFQTAPGMSIKVGNITLYPIKGIKLSLPGSRHWPISRKHPEGKAFYEALERGLTELESKGTIQKAYRECGVFHPDVADWKLLNAEKQTNTLLEKITFAKK